MTEDLEYLKNSAQNHGSPNLNTPLGSTGGHIGLMPNSTGGVGEKGWGSRRSNKVVKMELLDLQRNLQSEIRAKQQINEELTKTRSAYLATKQRLEETDAQVADLQRELDRKDLQLEDLQRQIGMQLGSSMVEYVDNGGGVGAGHSNHSFKLINDGGGQMASNRSLTRPDSTDSHNSSINISLNNEYEVNNTTRDSQQRDRESLTTLNNASQHSGQLQTYENLGTMPSGGHQHRHTPPNTFARNVHLPSPKGKAASIFCE